MYSAEYGSCGLKYSDTTSETIYSPRWPGSYKHDLNCTWEIEIPKNKNYTMVKFEFKFFELQNNSDTLSISTKNSEEGISQKANLHGLRLPDDVVVLLEDVDFILLNFLSDGALKHDGFIINFHGKERF